MARLVLTDSSPLLGLSRVGGVVWLHGLFGTVEMTPSLWHELARGARLEPAISEAVEQGWLVVRRSDPAGPARPPHLGSGEWSTILAAAEHGGEALLLMDDRLARRQAEAAGRQVAGTAAIIGMAQRRGLLPSAREVFERLLRSDFRISAEVIQAVLDALE